MQRLNKNSVFHDRFRIIECLGEGGMGFVYRAYQLDAEREVAIKVLKPELTPDETNKLRFKRECRILSELDSPHIPAFFHYAVTAEGICYCVYEYLEGQTLTRLIKDNKRLTIQEFIPILQQICLALKVAHDRGIVHRDLKPDNIMLLAVPEPRFVKLLDFGLSQTIDPAVSQKLTSTGHLLGTANYMSPEQCRGEHVDQRSDLYSLGCTMIECLSGTAPFQADSPIGVLYKHQNQDAGPLCDALAGPLPQSVIRILKQLLAKDARDRQASVDALLLQIQQIDFAACGLQERANVSHPALKLAVPAKIAILLVLLFGAIAVASWLYMKVREDAVSQVRKSASLDAYDVPRDPKLLLNRVKTLRNSNAQVIAGLEMVHAWLEKYGDSPKVTDVDRLMVLSRLTGHGRTEEEFKVAFRSGEKLLKKLGKSTDEILARMSFLSECYPLAHNYNCFVQEIENESAATIKVLQENPLPFALIEPCRNVAAALVSFDRNKEAVQLLEAFFRQYKQSLGYYPSHSTKILSTLADAYVGLGESEKALAAYRQALESVMQEQKVSLVRALRNPRDFEESKYIFLAERASFCPSFKEKCTLLSIDFLRQRSGAVPADINSALEVYKVVEETGVNELNAQAFLNGAVWFRKQSAALSRAYLGAFNILSWERAKYLLEHGDVEKGLDEYKFVSEICKKIDDPYSKKRSLEIAEILFKLKQDLAAQKVLKDSGVELSAKWKPDGSTPQLLAYAALPATAYASGNILLAQETWDKQTANCSSRSVVEISLKDMMRYHESERARRLFIRAATHFAEESSKYPQEHRAKLALLMGRLFLANGDSQSAAFYLRDAKRTFAAMGDSRNFIDRSLPITHCHALLLQCKQKSGDSDLVAK